MSEINAILDLVKRIEAEFIVVTNEVGLGIVPDNELARRIAISWALPTGNWQRQRSGFSCSSPGCLWK